MKTILVTGANGQLGNSIRLLAGKYSGYNFLFTDVDTLDITDPAAVRAMVKDNGVNYILNCAAYTAVDKAEDDEALCRRINTFAVGVLGKAAHEAGAKMIHVSTDYVFSGTNCRPYVETDATRPVSAYGRTKLAGEEILQEVCPNAVIIRTAWLYSEFGNNFVKTVLRLSSVSYSTRSGHRLMQATWQQPFSRWLTLVSGMPLCRGFTIFPTKVFAAGMILR